MRLDSSGNLGLGVTPSAWSGATAIQVGSGSYASVSGSGTYGGAYTSNAYYNSGWKYIGSNNATLYQQLGGAHSWHTAASGTAGNAISFTQAMTLDASGNLGVGTTSPATFAKSAFVAASGSNALYAGTGTQGVFISADNSSRYVTYNASGNLSGGHIWQNGNTEFMRLDLSGNLGIGTTSPSARVHAGNASGTTPGILTYNAGNSAAITSYSAVAGLQLISYQSDSGSPFTKTSALVANSDGTVPSVMQFWTKANGDSSPSERARITSGGDLLVGNTASVQTSRAEFTSTSLTPAFLARVNVDADEGQWAGQFQKKTATSTTSQIFVRFLINDGATASGYITANGANAATFTSSSDSRLKENIAELPSQWGSIKALRPVEFDYIQSEGGGHQVGFVAQDFEQVYPDSVGERPDGMKMLSGWSKTEARMVKALQEAMARIEKLEAEVAALKGV
jgi:hypothetical protein